MNAQLRNPIPNKVKVEFARISPATGAWEIEINGQYVGVRTRRNELQIFAGNPHSKELVEAAAQYMQHGQKETGARPGKVEIEFDRMPSGFLDVEIDGQPVGWQPRGKELRIDSDNPRTKELVEAARNWLRHESRRQP